MTFTRVQYNKSSAVAQMATMAITDMGRKERAAVSLVRRSGTPSGPRSTYILSGVFIHPAVWLQ